MAFRARSSRGIGSVLSRAAMALRALRASARAMARSKQRSSAAAGPAGSWQCAGAAGWSLLRT
eukprot:10269658-Lingulodinium_polyedra.AAC.1